MILNADSVVTTFFGVVNNEITARLCDLNRESTSFHIWMCLSSLITYSLLNNKY